MDVIDRDHFDDFMINGGIDNELCGSDEEDSFLIPATSAGDLPVEVFDETPKEAVHIIGHVILNQCGSVLTRKKHELKGSSSHKYFHKGYVQRQMERQCHYFTQKECYFHLFSTTWSMRQYLEQSLLLY